MLFSLLFEAIKESAVREGLLSDISSEIPKNKYQHESVCGAS